MRDLINVYTGKEHTLRERWSEGKEREREGVSAEGRQRWDRPIVSLLSAAAEVEIVAQMKKKNFLKRVLLLPFILPLLSTC